MKKLQARAGVWVGFVASAVLASCSGGSTESVETAAVTASGDGSASDSGSGSCNLAPIDDTGAMPACAAGTSGSAGPGLPQGFAGSDESSMPLSAADLAGLAADQALGLARNPPGQDPVERGFGTPPSRGTTTFRGDAQVTQ